MKRLIFISCLLLSFNASSLELVLGGFSKHIGPQKYQVNGESKRFNDSHNLIAVGYDSKSYFYSAAKFKNSYYIDSYAVSILKRFKQIRYGVTVSTGYDKFDGDFYQKYQPSITIRYDYKNISFITLGSALSVSINVDMT